MMDAIGITDHDWFERLRGLEPTPARVNFWTPTPWRIRQVGPGSLWYFMLKTPVRKVAGVGTVVSYEPMPISEAWAQFGIGNGVASLDELRERTQRYAAQRATPRVGDDYEIGCIILTKCEFWDEADYLDPERDLGTPVPDQVVKFKHIAPLDASVAGLDSYRLGIAGEGHSDGQLAAEAVRALEEAQEGKRGSGQGFSSNKAVRDALEQYSMRLAHVYFERMGYDVEDTSSNRPYDLVCTKGDRVVHVEVKGTQSSGAKVFLTRGEVEASQSAENESALFIQHSVEIESRDGEPAATGGKMKVIWPWVPDGDDLVTVTFQYSVPAVRLTSSSRRAQRE